MGGGGAPPRFDPDDLLSWWASNLDFSLLGGPDRNLIDAMNSFRLSGLLLVAFSNSPRKYVLRVLREIGMEEFFPPSLIFGVDDILPLCKPESAAFERVLESAGISDPRECVMVEDSMKNIRAAKAMGMRTVLVAGRGRLGGVDDDDATASRRAEAAEATKPGDAPERNDPSVNVVVEVCSDMAAAITGLLLTPTVFSTAVEMTSKGATVQA